jgi:uncharacterized protein YceK
MVTKKLFALASVSAIAGLMTTVTASGCSSTTTETAPSGEGGTSSSGGTSKDASTKDRAVIEEEDSGEATDCPANVPLTEADLEKEIGWKPAKANPSACSAADITKLEANFKNTNIKTYFDLGEGLPQPCFDCVFAKDTDANWGPIVGTAENNGETGFVNFGACFGYVEDADCGKALQYEQFCYNVACNECTTTSTERQKCVEKAGSSGMCTEFGDATQKACPNIQTSAKKCNSIIDAAKTLCGSGVADAGKG